MSKRFYITTAIDYVNGQPHLGHAYEKVITDVIARARRSLGQEVFFLTGLDEHGQKVQQAAQAEGKTPQAYCDELAADWQAFAQKLELTNDDFVRTTQPRHKAVVQAMLTKLHDQGDFYKADLPRLVFVARRRRSSPTRTASPTARSTRSTARWSNSWRTTGISSWRSTSSG